jgi:hypothetical protein
VELQATHHRKVYIPKRSEESQRRRGVERRRCRLQVPHMLNKKSIQAADV